MAFGCPICSEKLDKLPAEAQRGAQRQQAEVNISATPCGHLFHSYCIQKWLTGNLQSSKQCPCCRKEVPKLRCLSLFPTSYDESILDDSLSQEGGGGGPAYQPCNHGELITSLKNQVARLQNEVTEKGQLYDLLTGDYETLLERFRQEKMTSDTWMMKSKQFESYKDLAEEMEVRARNAEEKVKTLQTLDGLLKGVEIKVNEDLVNFPPSVESVRSLLETRYVITAELKSANKKYNELKKNYELIRKEKVVLKGQFDKKVRELKELKHLYDMGGGASQAGPSPMMTGPTASNGLLDQTTTPAAFRSKRRLREPVPSTSSGASTSTFPSSSSSSSSLSSIHPNKHFRSPPGVDADVDVFEPAFKIRKPKNTAALASSSKSKHFSPISPPSSKSSKEGPAFKVKVKAQAQPKKQIPKFTCGVSPIKTSDDKEVKAKDKTKEPAESPRDKTINLCSDSSSEELLDLDCDDDNDKDVSRIPASDSEDNQDSQEDFMRIRGNVVGAPLPISSSKLKSLKRKSESPVLGLSRKNTIPTKRFVFNKKR